MADTASGRSVRFDQYDATSTDAPGTYRGWAAVDVSLRRRDNALVRDCDEDLNALLVLAGLFSTVLTAFLATSFGWLQEDFTQTTAELLVQLSAQIADPATRSRVASPSSFQPATTDVAINLLWFFSLVLTLAAALFGMIVKQWLREYLAWQTEGPQDAIWLRQIRHKAFMKWKVTIIVALLPGLLEVALVLFMVGIIVLLWTLHLVLAIIITTLSSVLLVMAFATIIIPTFMPHCPYRSPAGWACVVLWGNLCRACNGLLGNNMALRNLYAGTYRHSTKGWKDIDKEFSVSASADVDPLVEREAVKLAHLVEAAASTYDHCQNPRVLDDLDFTVLDPIFSEDSSMRLYILMYAICRYFKVASDTFFPALRAQHASLGHSGSSGPVVLHLASKFDILNPWEAQHGVISLHILGSFILTETVALFTDLCKKPRSGSSSHCKTMDDVMDAFCLLSHITRMLPTSRLKTLFADHLVKLYHKLSHSDALDQQFPGLRTVIVQILRRMSFVQISDTEIHIDLEQTLMNLKAHAELAISVYRSNPNYSNPENRHLFVTLADLALAKCDGPHAYDFGHVLIERLLQCINEAMQISLDKKLRNCGYYGDLPWIASLLVAAKTTPDVCSCFPKKLLKVLEDGLDAGLVTDYAARAQLADLKARYNARSAVSMSEKEHAFAEHESRVSTDELGRTDDVASIESPFLGTPSCETLTEEVGSHYR